MRLSFCLLNTVLFLLLALLARGSKSQKFIIKGFNGDPVKEFENEFKIYNKNLQMTKTLQKLIEIYKAADDDYLLCARCHSIVNLVIKERRVNASIEEITEIMLSICVNLKLMGDEMCESLIYVYSNTIAYIIDNTKHLTASDVCGLMYQKDNCSLTPRFDWKIDIDHRKQINITTTPKLNDSSVLQLNVLQLSDIHFDPKYQQGSNALCGKSACCRIDQGIVHNVQNRAGKWGDYRGCDTPEIAVKNAFDHIRKQHNKIDIVYYTGDIIDHGMWETSITKNTNSIKKVFQEMFMISKNILPVLGNHEPHPSNLFSPKNVSEEFNTKWLYELLNHAIEFSSFSMNAELTLGGYYTVLIEPGFRIIGLNSNVAYIFNFWLLHDPTFPKEQLQWLHDTLLKAEKNNENVHILGHVPPGETTNFITWDREYRKIIERFSDIITGQFNGHTHTDEFKLYYNSTNSTIPINIAFNGGSITSFTDKNPNYKIYKVETKKYTITDYESWYYNLTSANLMNSNPEWKQLYNSFKKEFSLNSLNSAELNKMLIKMKTDKDLAKKYINYKVRLADTELAKSCDKNCITDHLCAIVTTIPYDDEYCRSIVKSASQAVKSWSIFTMAIITYGNLML